MPRITESMIPVVLPPFPLPPVPVDGVAVGDGDTVGLGEGLGDGEGDGEGLGDGAAVGEGVGVGDGVGEGVGDGVGEGAGGVVGVVAVGVSCGWNVLAETRWLYCGKTSHTQIRSQIKQQAQRSARRGSFFDTITPFWRDTSRRGGYFSSRNVAAPHRVTDRSVYFFFFVRWRSAS